MGRPKGSKNKKTIEREQMQAQASAPKRRGRPPGSKNKKTIERQEARATMDIVIDKEDQVFCGDEQIGLIEYDDGVFIGINRRTQRQARSFDYDHVVAWFKGEKQQEVSA